MIRQLTARDTRLSSFRYYDLLVHIFVVILLISNLVGQKICVIPFIHVFVKCPTSVERSCFFRSLTFSRTYLPRSMVTVPLAGRSGWPFSLISFLRSWAYS